MNLNRKLKMINNNIWLYWELKKNMNDKIDNHLQIFLKKYITFKWVKQQMLLGIDTLTLSMLLTEIFVQLYLPVKLEEIEINDEIKRNIYNSIYDWVKIKTIEDIRKVSKNKIIKLKLKQFFKNYFLKTSHLN